MKTKILNVLLIISSLLGYLEWGKNSKMFLLQGEIDIIQKLFTNPGSVLHPFILLPLLGQLILFITLFQKKPSSILTYIGIGCMALLLLLITFIGLIGPNYKMFFSTIPFIVFSMITLHHHKIKKRI